MNTIIKYTDDCSFKFYVSLIPIVKMLIPNPSRPYLTEKRTYYISEDSRPHEIDHLRHLIDVDDPLALQLLGQRGEGAEHAR